MQSCIISFLIVLLDIITGKGFKRTFPKFSALHWRGIRMAFIIQSAVSVTIVVGGFILQRYVADYRLIAGYYYLFGIIVLLYFPKSVFVSFMFADWVFFKIHRWYRLRTSDLFCRSRFTVSKCGFWTGIVMMGLFVWGIFFGRYNFTIDQVEISAESLPVEFNGYKIIQISDIHAGSFAGSTKRFQKAIDMINHQSPDLIVFTGDMVNNFADEAIPLTPVFSQLDACDGKFAVLGNHDYGGYTYWDTPADSMANHDALKNAIERMGFVILNNQSVTITRCDSACITLIGTENWGVEERHPKQADLNKAMESIHDIPFKVLLAHNPLFWPKEVEGKTDIALTLAGHTHGMQMGVKLGKRRYSPAMFKFLHWGGLYQTGKQYLYVNRGLGVIAFPGRIGMSPEITLITLWKEKY